MSARGNWMQTFTGGRFYPLDPRPEEVHAADIAHALSLICRYGGHATRFYSVAEHCVLMSRAVAPEFALWALLHDASEAYVGDMVRPLKQQMPDYQRAEDWVLLKVAERFGLTKYATPGGIPREVREADARILLDERAAVLPATDDEWDVDGLEPLDVPVTGWDPLLAEFMYAERLRELTQGGTP